MITIMRVKNIFSVNYQENGIYKSNYRNCFLIDEKGCIWVSPDGRETQNMSPAFIVELRKYSSALDIDVVFDTGVLATKPRITLGVIKEMIKSGLPERIILRILDDHTVVVD